jgi:tetratricopeptide (TPR) repeat protein
MMHSIIQDHIIHGRFLEARAKAEEALKTQPDSRLQQLYALALSKSGASEAARAFLEPHYNTNPEDPETAGILAGIYKELFKKNKQSSFALLSRDTYLKNFLATKNYYTGINAATMSAMIMQSSKSKEIAQQIINSLHADTTDYWEMVTLAEAYLLIKEKSKAVEQYARARRTAAKDWGKIGSVYNQLWLLNHYIQVPLEVLKIFTPPRVMAFSGHMIDRPSRKSPRFPIELEPKIKAIITSHLETMQPQIGFCSLACGSDIIFAETLLEMGGEVKVWLPFDVTDFEEVSLRFAGEGWVERFRKLMEKVPHENITRQHYEGNDRLFVLLSKIIFGSAILESSRYHSEPFLLTVLSDTDLKQNEGGTRDAISHWPYVKNMTNVNPEAFLKTIAWQPPAEFPASTQSPRLRSVHYFMLFDLNEMPPFEKLKTQKMLMDLSEFKMADVSIVQNSKILFSFQIEHEAMNGLKKALESLRKINLWKLILHAGPDLKHDTTEESLTILLKINQDSPVTHTYGSHSFAALLALDTTSFVIDYSGQVSGETMDPQLVYKISLANSN